MNNRKIVIYISIILIISLIGIFIIYMAPFVLFHHKPFDSLMTNYMWHLCEDEKSYFSIKGRYAASLKELDEQFKSDLAKEARDTGLEIYFDKEEFSKRYPNINIDIYVKPDGFIIIGASNYDKDPTPHIRMINNDGYCYSKIIINDATQ